MKSYKPMRLGLLHALHVAFGKDSSGFLAGFCTPVPSTVTTPAPEHQTIHQHRRQPKDKGFAGGYCPAM